MKYARFSQRQRASVASAVVGAMMPYGLLIKRSRRVPRFICGPMSATSLRAYHAKESTSLLRARSEEHTSELQSRGHLVCRLLLEKKKEYPRLQSARPFRRVPAPRAGPLLLSRIPPVRRPPGRRSSSREVGERIHEARQRSRLSV